MPIVSAASGGLRGIVITGSVAIVSVCHRADAIIIYTGWSTWCKASIPTLVVGNTMPPTVTASSPPAAVMQVRRQNLTVRNYFICSQPGHIATDSPVKAGAPPLTDASQNLYQVSSANLQLRDLHRCPHPTKEL